MTSKKLLFALTAAITAVLFLLSNAYASENVLMFICPLAVNIMTHISLRES